MSTAYSHLINVFLIPHENKFNIIISIAKLKEYKL